MVDLKLDVRDGEIIDIQDHEQVGFDFVKIPGRFFIPKDVTSIDNEATIDFDPVSIEVEEGNSVFYAKNNCLIRRKDNVLCMACSNSVIPDDGSITAIGPCAFNTPMDLTKMNLNPLRIPNSVKEIGYRAFAITSENAIHFIVPQSVENVYCMAFMARSEKGPVKITFEGSPELEVGVFGTKEESVDSDFGIYKQLPELVYTPLNGIMVYCHKDSTVEAYCRKYNITCELI